MKISILNNILPAYIRRPLAVWTRKHAISTTMASYFVRWQARKLQRARRNIQAPEGNVLIVCANFNHMAWVADCIASIRAQTFHQWQLVVVDDRSTDQSLQGLSKLAEEDARITLIQTPDNSGAYVARNLGVAYATSTLNYDWTHVTFIDPDDVAVQNWLSHLLSVMGTSKAVARPLLERWDETFTTRKRSYYGYCPSLIHRRVWEALEGFQPVRVAGDTEFLIRADRWLHLIGGKIIKGSLVAQRCRDHGGNSSSTRLIERKIWIEQRAEEVRFASASELKVSATDREGWGAFNPSNPTSESSVRARP